MVASRLALGMLGLGLTAVAPLSGQQTSSVFRGQVTDSLRAPVPGAELAIVGTDLRAVTDSQGRFRVAAVPVGLQPVIVRAVGWKPILVPIRIEPDRDKVVRIELDRAPQTLPELEVNAQPVDKPAEYTFTTRYDGFFRRKRRGNGTFRTRNDVWFTSAFYTADLLRGIPTVRVSHVPGGSRVDFADCRESYAKVAVWIDGARAMTADHNEALQFLRPSDIELIEVYRRSGQIPAEFLADACAAIVIWTR